MKIVIIGDGKVGYKLAKQLSSEKYDIILIDNNEEKLRKSIERMDVFCVAGEGGSVEVQQRADVPHADLVIACTSTDECNMLSCLIARRLGARHTIARVRNPIYYKQIDFLKKDLHLSMVVNPELIVAGDITRLLLFPDASKVETFVKGRVELVEFPIHCGKLEGLSLSELYARFQVQVAGMCSRIRRNGFNPGWRLYFKSRRQVAYCGFSSEYGAVLQEDCPAKRED